MRGRTKLFVTAIFFIVIYSSYFLTQLNKSSVPVNIGGATDNLVLTEEPDDGKSTILNAINSAVQEVDVEVYMLSDKDVISALINARQRGARVVVMLEHHPYGSPSFNNDVFEQLQAAGVTVLWTNPTFSLTHEKAIVIDGKKAFIMNQNLTASSFSQNREYDIEDKNFDDIVQIEKMFFADANRRDFNVESTNLVISPLNSRNMLTSLLKSATKEIDIETEVIDDNQIMDILEQASSKVSIEVLLPDFSQIDANKKIAEELSSYNIKVKTIKSPYVHAKLIIIDKQKAYVGSVNLTTQSMDENRELGIIISQTNIIQSLINDFSSDFSKAKN